MSVVKQGITMGIIVPKTLSFYRDGLVYSVSDVFVRNNGLHQSPQERLCLDWRVQMGQGIQFPVQECHSLYATEITELNNIYLSCYSNVHTFRWTQL